MLWDKPFLFYYLRLRLILLYFYRPTVCSYFAFNKIWPNSIRCFSFIYIWAKNQDFTFSIYLHPTEIILTANNLQPRILLQ